MGTRAHSRHRDVGCWELSRPQFRAAGGLLVARLGHSSRRICRIVQGAKIPIRRGCFRSRQTAEDGSAEEIPFEVRCLISTSRVLTCMMPNSCYSQHSFKNSVTALPATRGVMACPWPGKATDFEPPNLLRILHRPSRGSFAPTTFKTATSLGAAGFPPVDRQSYAKIMWALNPSPLNLATAAPPSLLPISTSRF